MNRYKKRHRAGCLLLLLLIIAVPAAIFAFHAGPQNSGQGIAPPQFKTSSAAGLSKKALYSRNAILLRLDDNTILLEKNSAEKIYPASLTKIMTAIVAVENIGDLNSGITLKQSIFRGLGQSDASLAGFKPGERVTAEDLLYGALLPSGAECCLGLADHVSGSEKSFVDLMNRKAALLGMSGTHFANVTGLQNKNHYTTVGDLAVLLKYALQNGTFRKVFTSSKYTVGATNKHPDGFTVHNTMFEKLKDPSISGGRILGGKTGYTEKAGLCLASLAREDGREYILVTAGAKGNHDTKQYDIADAFAVYNGLAER